MTERMSPPNTTVRQGTVLRSHDLAELAGTTRRALRHYHQIGLLPEAARDPNGYRRYRPEDLVRLLRIRQLAASGMPLRRIREVLDKDTQQQDEVLAELDEDLKTEIRRIEAQRKTIAELRALSIQTSRFSDAEHPTATQRLDHDVWTLVTATGGIDADVAGSMLDSLHGEPVVKQVAVWYPEFEQLEMQEHVDPQTIERLSGQMANFARAIMTATEFTPTDEEQPILPLIEQMQAAAFSPAQQKVWGRFVDLITADASTGPPAETSPSQN